MNTVLEPKTLEITNVQYFQAKLAFEMTPWSLKALLEKTPEQITLLDVRSPEMYALAHLPTAINIPLVDLVSKMNTLPKNKTVVTYCGSLTCALAPKAALELAQKGFAVRELIGGIATWQENGFPVEKKS
ncbi:MAG: rhodanese-like domain-containing protein [Elusimicrobia bacterium]|nr:rhodanese-like domain-containing protein [Elusimicrobiota bacterium]